MKTDWLTLLYLKHNLANSTMTFNYWLTLFDLNNDLVHGLANSTLTFKHRLTLVDLDTDLVHDLADTSAAKCPKWLLLKHGAANAGTPQLNRFPFHHLKINKTLDISNKSISNLLNQQVYKPLPNLISPYNWNMALLQLNRLLSYYLV